MIQPSSPVPKSPASHLHAVNLVVAMLAGIISITGGIYSLKNNLFSGPAYGSLQGIVRDQKIARPLKLASVEITDLAGAVVNTAETDDGGHYLIEALKTGNYVVKFTAPLHKVETKTIKIEKDLASSVSVDLVPEAPPSIPSPVEYASSVQKNIPATYVPATSYPVAAPVVPVYNVPQGDPSVPTASSAYSQGDPIPDPSSDPRYSGSYRRHPRRYPGDYDQTSAPSASSPNSQGSALATVGTQLLQAWMTKKSEESTTAATDGSGS